MLDADAEPAALLGECHGVVVATERREQLDADPQAREVLGDVAAYATGADAGPPGIGVPREERRERAPDDVGVGPAHDDDAAEQVGTPARVRIGRDAS